MTSIDSVWRATMMGGEVGEGPDARRRRGPGGHRVDDRRGRRRSRGRSADAVTGAIAGPVPHATAADRHAHRGGICAGSIGPLQNPGTPMSVCDLLATLKVAPEHRVGYDRDLFPHWIDADGDGCNTRYEVLIDEAVVAPTISGSCDLTGGTWSSPYDGVTLHGASEVQIDHLVPLAEAWYSGAFAWTTERRQVLANDLGVPWALVGVSGKTNEAKGSSDPASWLPPLRTAVCPYLDSWVAVKARWGLTIDIDEKEALTDRLADCPDTTLTVPIAAP